MTIQIKNKYTSLVLYSSDKAKDIKDCLLEAIEAKADLSYADLSYANLRSADLSYANLRSADLSYADLSYANLSSADLSYADLSYANLSYANLSSANLSSADLSSANLISADLSYANLISANLISANLISANLSYAKGASKFLIQPLLTLTFQPGKIRLFKMVTKDLKSPIKVDSPISYEIGKRYAIDNANTDPFEECGAGLHVATLEWITGNWYRGNRILICEFTAEDIASIPNNPSGKLRLHRMDVVGELDPKELNLE